jgi:hypothetical protein
MSAPIRAIAAATLVLSLAPADVATQWLRHPTAGVPRTREGKPNLAAPAPRTADGKPDFSGLWENDGFDPNRAEGLDAAGPPRTPFFDIAHGLTGAPPYQPWAADLVKKRKAEFGRDNPDARCLPLGVLQMIAHPLPKKIVHTPGLWYPTSATWSSGTTMGVRPTNGNFVERLLFGKWDKDTGGSGGGIPRRPVGGLWGQPADRSRQVTERFGGHHGRLEIEVTVDDPKALRTRGHRVGQARALDTDLLECACLESKGRAAPRWPFEEC